MASGVQTLLVSPMVPSSLSQVETVGDQGFSDTTVALILVSFLLILLLVSSAVAVVLYRIWNRRSKRRSAACGVPVAPRRWSRRSRLGALGAITLLTFALLLGGSYEAYGYWSDPDFCSSCHIMEPYHESWSESAHSEVRCVECHFEPGIGNELHGKWVAIKQLASTLAGSYSSMPYAEVSDASCMRSGCHSTEELQVPFTYSKREILFDHTAHIGEMRRGITLACTSCHHQRLITTHMEVDKSTCFICHFKNGVDGENAQADCATCHGPPAGPSEIGSLAVDHGDFVSRGMECTQCHVELRPSGAGVGAAPCLSCHNRPEQLDRYPDVGFLHAEHVTGNKLHCYQCHSLIEHAFDRDASRGEQVCASCHERSVSQQGLFYAGVGAKGLPSSPDPMHALGVDCTGCHRTLAPVADETLDGHRFAPGAESCQTCHGDRYSEFVTAVDGAFGEIHAHLAQRLGAIRSELARLSDSNQTIDRDVRRVAEDTGFNLDFLDKVGYIHNPLYGLEILRHGDQVVAALEERMGIATGDDPPAGLLPDECYVCHDALPEPDLIELSGGRPYPHRLHLEETGMECADCHIGERHPPRASTAEQSCRLCHDK